MLLHHVTIDVMSSLDPFDVSERLELVVNPSHPDAKNPSEVPVIVSVADTRDSKEITIQVLIEDR